jgi:cell division protein FtsW
MIFSRKDASIVGRWWWTVDRWSLISILIIIAIGVLLSFAATPAVAVRLNLDTFFFVKRHLLMLLPAFVLLFTVSLLPPKSIRRLATVVYLVGMILLVVTLFFGMEIKGARRWIVIAGTSLQTSEVVKPAFAILSAWMLAEKNKDFNFPGITISFLLMSILIFLLLLQPDLGMTLVVVATWVAQLFIAGLPMFWIIAMGGLGLAGLAGAYFIFPHVTKRIDQFFDPANSSSTDDLYQVTQSLEAFMHGGLFGRGPGEGIIKKNVPDAHADFVFSVAGEEFGLLLCLFLLSLFAFVVVRSMLRSMKDTSLFSMLATSGLVVQFGMQTLVNMASSLHLIPTKGMTMPFVSYGGSSLVALGLSVGMLLSLTRRRHGAGDML